MVLAPAARAAQRVGEAIGMIEEFRCSSALGAEVSTARGAIRVPGYAGDPVSFEMDEHLADAVTSTA
jgi:hypothetical protein